MSELEQIRQIVAMVYSLDLMPSTAINAIATVLDGGELLTPVIAEVAP